MKSQVKKAIAAALAALLLAVFVYKKRAVLIDIAVVLVFSCAFTLILSPLCRRLESRGFSPSGSAVLSIAVLLMVIVLLLASFIPYLITHSMDLMRRITPTLSQLLSSFGGLLAQFGLPMEQKSGLVDLLTASVTAMTARLARGSLAFAKQAGALGFSLVIAYYLLRERRFVANHLILLIPIGQRTAFLSALLGCKNAILGYLSGVLKTSLFVSVATFAGLALLGVRDAPLLALFMGFFEVLPYIGPVLAAIPILLVTLPQSLSKALLSLLIVVLVQQIEGNFVSPYFTASSTSIHPLAALVSVFVFGCLFGLWGILLAIPAVVTIRSVYWSVRQMTALMNV